MSVPYVLLFDILKNMIILSWPAWSRLNCNIQWRSQVVQENKQYVSTICIIGMFYTVRDWCYIPNMYLLAELIESNNICFQELVTTSLQLNKIKFTFAHYIVFYNCLKFKFILKYYKICFVNSLNLLCGAKCVIRTST